MCGFFGYISTNSTIDLNACFKSLKTLTHRGPDGFGLTVGQTQSNATNFLLNPCATELGQYQAKPNNFFLGHCRLSIIDLDIRAFQPMTNEDSTVWIVFNGEIYNHVTLRQTLEKCGHKFTTTNSDTEVLVHGYEQWGENLPNMLRGMFAFAILDLRRKQIFFARDRFGEKPLYYTISRNRILFSSELKAISQHPSFDKKISRIAIINYLACGVVPAPLSIYEGVYKIQPSQKMTISLENLDNISNEIYWKLQYSPSQANSITEWKEQFDFALHDAVKSRMVSDVPVGAFLSGGLDSSIVVREMSRLSNKPIQTFSIGFSDKRYDESGYALQVSDNYRTEHHSIIVSSDDLLEAIPTLQHHFDEPFADSSAIPTYLVSKLARHAVKVVLTGDGGDELLAGYKHYRLHATLSKYLDWLPDFLVSSCFEPFACLWPEAVKGKGLMKLVAANPLRRYAKHWCDDSLVIKLVKNFGSMQDCMFISHWPTMDLALINKLCLVDTRFFVPEDAMVKVDRSSMAVSLEARTPLLDHELFEIVAQMPIETRYDGRYGKLPFRDILLNDMGPEFVDRPKKGFAIPIGRWFREELKNDLYDTLLGAPSLLSQLFKSNDIHRLIKMHETGARDLSPQLWRLYILEKWHSIHGGVI